MAERATVDRVFNAIIEQTAEEVGALLGEPFRLENHQSRLLTKAQLFEVSRSRSVLTTLVISGDASGEGYLITDLKDSIVLGGTLIMLPADQIEENCKQRTFEGEAADAFGEVANIVAGVYTSVFLEMYPQNLHFKRTTVSDFLPSRLDPAAAEPFPPGEYYHSSADMYLGDTALQKLEVIVPAAVLGLASDALPEAEAVTAPSAQGPPPAAAQDEVAAEAVTEASAAQPTQEAVEEPPQEPAEVAAPAEPYVDLKTAERTLKAALNQCGEEIGTMLGIEISLSSLTTGYISKEEYFAKPGAKATCTQMLVSGDSSGISYFLVDLKDAIFFGGSLIMLPTDELEKNIQSGTLEGETADAFGEVANIISGALVQTFDEMYPRKFHLKKGEQQTFTPAKVLPEQPTPFPPGEYFQVCASMDADEQDLGRLCFLVPVDLLHIPPRPAEAGWGQPAVPASRPAAAQDGAGASVAPQPAAEPAATAAAAEKAVVLVYQQPQQPQLYQQVLQQAGYQVLCYEAGERFSDLRHYQLLGGFLVMEAVDDEGFAALIKVRAELPDKAPLVVAGPQWTRSDVLKAVRYGVHDILVSPASEAEIAEKCAGHLPRP
ncbi:hypothetical protein [Desulfuromonas thiophila]|uniref:Chemotaxis phosphatase CheX n=1 Tax=Desulfuromonas thiophila TaxID=57664 RepID=A0A1G7BM29_9BACT|nr:hypothetical protein [Desulfuromonas thiophila]SDE27977.1 hypothetical protein SAMN05661003_10697 [Desulfuromonas thiophila]